VVGAMLLPKTIVSFIGADSAICVILTDSRRSQFAGDRTAGGLKLPHLRR
jgi:hypothetical protein